jgi:hypothetical protein
MVVVLFPFRGSSGQRSIGLLLDPELSF